MKKWMALLLCGLLCLCVAGAMAEKPETVTLALGTGGSITLYPNGYIRGKGSTMSKFYPQDAATTQYIITGTKTADSPLDIYLVPYGKEYATEDVVYNISFDGVTLKAMAGCTAIRIGSGENGKDKGHTITLNLSNRAESLVQAHNHPAISSEIDRVTVNIHNHWGKLTLKDENGINGAFNSNITLNVAGKQEQYTKKDLTIENTGESLTPVNSLEKTLTTLIQGNVSFKSGRKNLHSYSSVGKCANFAQ